MLTLKVNGGWWDYVPPLRDLAPFRTYGSLRGNRGGGYSDTRLGRLPFEHRDSAEADTVDYVVWSYATPIAWHDTESGWQMPDVRYSPTTSKQQGRIRTALSQL